MSKGSTFAYGIILGAAAGLLLAPQSGRRTRALIRDKAVRYSKEISEYSGGKTRHVANKARGYAHNIKGALSRVGAEEGEPPTYI